MSYQNAPVKEGGTLLFKVLIALFDVIILKNKSPEIIHKKTVYLPNGVNTEFFTPHDRIICKDKLGLDRQKRYILFFSYKHIQSLARENKSETLQVESKQQKRLYFICKKLCNKQNVWR
jgi:glycosyltransferase involved in cell wall biosynthesis